MSENLTTPRIRSGENIAATLKLPEISPATNVDILAYLRHSYKMAEIAAHAQEYALILAISQQLEINVSEDELQLAGDKFREENRLFTAAETLTWLEKQRIQIEDWSESIRVKLLKQKLLEVLFGANVDSQYLVDPNVFQRVALSQILVVDLTDALRIVQKLREDKSLFCSLAIEYSKGRQSKDNGGFVGIRFLGELMPELSEAISNGQEGEVIGPIQTNLGYHILKIENKFLPDFREVKEQVLEFLFQTWLKSKMANG
jgi:parvulin-like peptidyl-prolyl isomerase